MTAIDVHPGTAPTGAAALQQELCLFAEAATPQPSGTYCSNNPSPQVHSLAVVHKGSQPPLLPQGPQLPVDLAQLRPHSLQLTLQLLHPSTSTTSSRSSNSSRSASCYPSRVTTTTTSSSGSGSRKLFLHFLLPLPQLPLLSLQLLDGGEQLLGLDAATHTCSM